MPSRPAICRGVYDPMIYGSTQVDAIPPAELSKTPRECTFFIAGSDEVLRVPLMVSTTIWDVKEMLSDRLSIEPSAMTFVQKSGAYSREMYDHEECGRKCLVKGIKSFNRLRVDYEHPMAIIGAGHIGLRMSMVFLKQKQYNFVCYDRKPKVGGISWWDQANTTSKLQTEAGVYHLDFDEELPVPDEKYWYPWPSRNDLLAMFDRIAGEMGIIPYCKLAIDVKDVIPDIKKGNDEANTYDFTLQELQGERQGEITTVTHSAVALFPGNLSLPRRETYKGEELFGGVIGYAMFDEVDYEKVIPGQDCAIIGHGAFAVENVRTCCEYYAKQIYLVCRRKNLACPRFMSWLCNQSGNPVSAMLFLNGSTPMYNLIGVDPWEYYAVQSNTARTTCSIQQKARFGIGDVYFLAISWGKLRVIEDKLSIKRLAHHALYCGNGEKLDVSVILKLLGFVGNPANDRLLKIKEMQCFFCNEDPKRYLVAEPISVMASNFGGTSFSPGAIEWAYHGAHFFHFPKDFRDKLLATGLLPRHKADGEDRPAYVVDARHGTQGMMLISSVIQALAERGPIHGWLKTSRMRTMHPIDRFIQWCKEDWNHYTDRFKAEGLTGPEYPYTPEVAHYWYHMYEEEEKQAQQKMIGRQQ